jgi:hypothetical protein
LARFAIKLENKVRHMRRSFPFHDLNDEEFEQLSNHVCMEILGTGTIVFATGKDGGRDGTFEGAAQNFPSNEGSLKGKFVIQAKHTSNPIASCSDPEFAKLLESEETKIKLLIEAGELEHYMVFTNRKKPATTTILKEATLKKLGLKSANIFGVEQLRDWLTHYPDVWKNLGFDRFDSKFELNASDLIEVIHAFYDATKDGGTGTESATDFEYVSKKTKNKINKLSDAYDDLIRRDSLIFFQPIEDFLKNPRNEELRNLYHDTADEIRAKLVVNAEKFENFDEALTFMHDHVVAGASALQGRKRYVRIFLHYMYWTCDIGQHD